MKPETILKKLNAERKDWLKRIAFQIYLAAWHEAFHASWSDCLRCREIKQRAISSIKLVRSLR